MVDICIYMYIQIKKIHGNYYCLLCICVEIDIYRDVKIPWRYTKIDLFALYGGLNW